MARVLDLGAMHLGWGGREEAQGPKWRGGEAYFSKSDESVILKVIDRALYKLGIDRI